MYVRVCVRLDLAARLPKGVWVLGINGKFFQPVKFEGIPLLCFKCGMVGHKEVNCPSKASVAKKPTVFGTTTNPISFSEMKESSRQKVGDANQVISDKTAP